MSDRTSKQNYANDLIVSQLGDREQYQKLTKFIAENFDSIDDTLHFISKINIFTAEKKWLDLIGIIVGLDRSIPSVLSFEYFNFAEYPGARGFDDGRWYETGEPLSSTSLLPDAEYRVALLAKVAKNYGDVSGPGIVYALQNMLGDVTINLFRGTGGNMRIEIAADISSNFNTLIYELDIIPRAAGIGYEVEISPSNVFGYIDLNPEAKSYGFGRYSQLIT